MMPSRFPTSSGSKSRVPKPRGNTLVLVTVILVLLVIIAVAFISRTQGGRVIAAAQRKAIDREDRAEIAVGAVQDLVGGDLFPGLVDPSDPLVQGGLAASSATPTLSLDSLTLNQGGNPVTQEIVRYGVDPSGFRADVGADSLLYPYNFAPFQTIPWTNWPDVPGADGNLFPYGPGNLGGVVHRGQQPNRQPRLRRLAMASIKRATAVLCRRSAGEFLALDSSLLDRHRGKRDSSLQGHLEYRHSGSGRRDDRADLPGRDS